MGFCIGKAVSVGPFLLPCQMTQLHYIFEVEFLPLGAEHFPGAGGRQHQELERELRGVSGI